VYYFTYPLSGIKRADILSIWDFSRATPIFCSPHTHSLESLCFLFDFEAFSVSLRPCNTSYLCVLSHDHCPMTPGPANFHPQDLSLPTAMSPNCPWFLFSSVLCVLSCSLSLELFPVLGTSQEKLTHNTGGTEERFLQLCPILQTYGEQWEQSTPNTALPLALMDIGPLILHNNPLKQIIFLLRRTLRFQEVKSHVYKDTTSKSQSQELNPGMSECHDHALNDHHCISDILHRNSS
jgi:hypothetical protein